MTQVPTAIEMIERLVAIDTTSHKSNLEAIGLIKDYLERYGAICRLSFDETRRKANLYATVGPTDRPGVLLSGHTDVVPVDGQQWSSDPFRLTRREDRLYARGAADMKSFIGLCLAFVPQFAARGAGTPLHFAFSYDEEIGCVGVRRLIEDMAALPVRPRLCIVGEPTNMRLISGHKGRRSTHCHVHGKESHSALDNGANAVEAAAEVIARIKQIQRRIRRQGPFDPAYLPPYTTLQTGQINGGHALNIVPGDCWFDFEIRPLPLEDTDALYAEILAFARDEIEPELKAVTLEAGVAFTITNDTVGSHLDENDPALRFVMDLTGDNSPGRVSFATEAGLFTQAGVPTVVCGPGSIEQAHKADEYITLEQIAQGEVFLRRLGDRLCS
jgi:acetylornithine deacetylase